MVRSRLLFLLFLNLVGTAVLSQSFTPLWPEGKKPNSNGIKITDSIYNERIWRVNTPGYYSFPVPASENNGTSILICPGGGYERVSYIYNGFQFAKYFNSIGINVFVLIYRLPHQADLINKQIAGLQDAQRAMRLIRSDAVKLKLDVHKIGVMGISAGSHLATLLGTHPEDVSAIKDAIDTNSYRPDFMVLLSPVITMDKYAHKGSRKNFLGADTSAAMIAKYSSEKNVTAYTPPTFLVHALNDSTVNVHNSLLFYNALLDKNINASIHIFPQGGHGIRITDNPGSTDLWLDLLKLWLKETGFVKPIPFK